MCCGAALDLLQPEGSGDGLMLELQGGQRCHFYKVFRFSFSPCGSPIFPAVFHDPPGRKPILCF